MVTHVPHASVAATCAICGGTMTPWLHDVADPQTHEIFAIHRCPNCGVGATQPQPERLDAYYGEQYYGDRHGLTARYCMWRRCGWLERVARRHGRLLDVGCGNGGFMAAAAARGWNVAGVEVGQAARDRASAIGPVFAELSAVPADARFDVITLWHSFEHFVEPRVAIQQLRHHLVDQGVIIIAVPDAGGVQAAVFGPVWFHFDVPRHLYHFTQRSLGLLLSSEGLPVRRWGHQELEYDLFGWIQSALNRAGATHNGLFASLTGKPHDSSRSEIIASYAATAALLPPALVATLVTAVSGRGGTLIAVASKRSL